MRIGTGAARGVVLLTLSLLAACGTGGSHVDPIFQGVVGPDGGTVEVTNVRLVLFPGSLTADVAVRILPQPDPLPLDPQDGPIDELPGLMCIGPVGQDLVVPAKVRYCYDPSVLPVGADETDLVLLVWDDANGFLHVSQTAVQDLVTHCFEDTVYVELGHIGIGLRTGPVLDFLVQATDPNLQSQGVVQIPLSDSLVLASSDGGATLLPLPNTQYATLYIPSPDGQRVKFRVSDPEIDGQLLRTVDTATGDVLWESDSSLSLQPYDPLFGWFPDTDHSFYAHAEFEVETGWDVFADVTLGGAEHQHLRDGPFDASLVDVRVSPDGSRTLLRWNHYFEGFDSVDVIASSTGAIVGSDLPVLPAGSISPTPRWLPDSSGLYYPDPTVDGVVRRIDADGTDAGVLYSVPGGSVLEFVLAPDASLASLSAARCAYVRANFVLQLIPAAVTPQGEVAQTTLFGRDVLAGGARVEQDLGFVYAVNELAYHPGGHAVLAELSVESRIGGGQLGLINPPPAPTFVAIFDAADASTLRTVNVNLGALDVSRQHGAILVWIQTDTQDAQFPTAGIWRLAPDGSGGTLVDLPDWMAIGPPRFLASWRTACAEAYSSWVR